MRRWLFPLMIFCSVLLVTSASAATGKVVKVLPHFLDLQGRHTKSPSLYDRDAYQAWLRRHPEQQSGIRYDVEWRAKGVQGALKLRLELRGIAQGNLPRQKTIETEVSTGHGGTHWSGVTLKGDDFKAFGEVTAWRVTLWNGDQQLGEQKSFLW